MYIGLIARRYAVALADFALKSGQEDVVYNEVQHLLDLYASNPTLKVALETPLLGNGAKQAAIVKLMGGSVSSTLESFLKLVFAHDREKYFQFILHSYIAIYKERHGVINVKLTTVAPLGKEGEERISKLVMERTGGKEVELQATTDESIIGGFALRMDDLLIDETIATQLARIKREMTSKNNRIV